jgi:hypothetical protein
MVYNFLLEFVDIFSFLNVFKYITFRTGSSSFYVVDFSVNYWGTVY